MYINDRRSRDISPDKPHGGETGIGQPLDWPFWGRTKERGGTPTASSTCSVDNTQSNDELAHLPTCLARPQSQWSPCRHWTREPSITFSPYIPHKRSRPHHVLWEYVVVGSWTLVGNLGHVDVRNIRRGLLSSIVDRHTQSRCYLVGICSELYAELSGLIVLVVLVLVIDRWLLNFGLSQI